MVIGIRRVMSFCAIVLFAESFFGMQAVATDNRVRDLAKQAGVRILQDSTSDRTLQKTAAAQVPLQRMSQRSRARATHLLENTSQYRRMPTLQYEVDASLYQYLINHPDVAIATWRVMGISKLNMWQTAPFEYAAEATDGSEGRADVLWRDANQCLFVVEGAYHSPLLPGAIEASALVWLRYRFQRTSDNKVVVSQQIETFVNFPSAAIEAIAKLASMVTNSILDRNVMEVSLYAQMMSRAVHKDPRWVEEVADRMEGIPEHRKTELARVAHGMNPYESSGSSQVASGSLRNADRAETRRRSDPLNVSTTLSDSKQQLLRAVRTGNVVVIVKQKAEKHDAGPYTLRANDTSFEGAGSGGENLTAISAKQPAASVSSAAVSGLPLTATGPVGTGKSMSGSGTTRHQRTGDSKDGVFQPLPTLEFSTGPMGRPASETIAPIAGVSKGVDRHEVSDSDSVFVNSPVTSPPEVSTNDQPALVILPPVSSP